ncbi:response regulator [Acidobacteriota bacterium]
MDAFRVLLVDDEADFLTTLIKRLKKRKVNVEGAGSAEDALTALEKQPADVVILDVKMPGMSGMQALKEIKIRHPLTEVIMLTGHASVEVAIQGMEAGAFDYLMKPMDIDELLYKVQDAYKKKSLQEAKIKNIRKVSGVSDIES